eukprot:TRINITY_DN1418_c0_g1_i2.p1 TRINITY_DN1418_c0_g1~~TRINITY_DN1418_c0_g1_i2.p1  ORF type:complete len:436 (-),score=133.94 TRINITY_DN1418_c0_g1_i2:243-1550(-)
MDSAKGGSRIQGFFKLSREERLALVKERAELSDEIYDSILAKGAPTMGIAEKMIENVIGIHSLPLGVATNFLINGKEYLIPMVTEEASVVAAASNAARLARDCGGFTATHSEPIVIGQIQIKGFRDAKASEEAILSRKEDIIAKCNAMDTALVRFGGGVRDVKVRVLETIRGPFIVVHLHVDTRDAMGANLVNTMCEGIAPYIAELCECEAPEKAVRLRILSNLATERTASARVAIDVKTLGGEEVLERMLDAYAFADADPYRAATHNKGVMNGVTALVMATGNDTRAVEAGAHAFASMSGKYKPLTRWWREDKDGVPHLMGEITLPTLVGTVGGITRTHPTARASHAILHAKTASELGEVMAALGLAQNMAALRALATDGIQKGHMKLHARTLCATMGCPTELLDQATAELMKLDRVTSDAVKDVVARLTEGRK